MKQMLRFSGLFLLIFLFSFTLKKDKKIIVIDPGHGGEDFGANKRGVLEKDLVLQIAKKIKEQNQNKEVEIILTRDSDNYPSLTERTDLMNKLHPNFVISIHANSSKNPTMQGSEVYAQSSNLDLAKKLSEKFANCKVEEKNLHILRESKSPTMLLEVGFLSNDKDREYINSENGKTETAEKILEFINEN